MKSTFLLMILLIYRPWIIFVKIKENITCLYEPSLLALVNIIFVIFNYFQDECANMNYMFFFLYIPIFYTRKNITVRYKKDVHFGDSLSHSIWLNYNVASGANLQHTITPSLNTGNIFRIFVINCIIMKHQKDIIYYHGHKFHFSSKCVHKYVNCLAFTL